MNQTDAIKAVKNYVLLHYQGTSKVEIEKFAADKKLNLTEVNKFLTTGELYITLAGHFGAILGLSLEEFLALCKKSDPNKN